MVIVVVVVFGGAFGLYLFWNVIKGYFVIIGCTVGSYDIIIS